MERSAYLYVLDTLSDWEPGYAVAELNSGRFFKEPGQRIPVRTVGVTEHPITTMGGVEITPEVSVSDVTPDKTAVLLLAGADTWDEPQHKGVLQKARSYSTPTPTSPQSAAPPAPSPTRVPSTTARTLVTACNTSRWSHRSTRVRRTTWSHAPWPMAT